MPVHVSYRAGKYRISPNERGPRPLPAQIKRRAKLLRARDNGWKPEEEYESVACQAQILADALLEVQNPKANVQDHPVSHLPSSIREAEPPASNWKSKLLGFGYGLGLGSIAGKVAKGLFVPPSKDRIVPPGMQFSGRAWKDDQDKLYNDPQGREAHQATGLEKDVQIPSGRIVYRDASGRAFKDADGRLPVKTEGLERGNVEPTQIRGGKTRGKFKFPRNWKVGHAIKY